MSKQNFVLYVIHILMLLCIFNAAYLHCLRNRRWNGTDVRKKSLSDNRIVVPRNDNVADVPEQRSDGVEQKVERTDEGTEKRTEEGGSSLRGRKEQEGLSGPKQETSEPKRPQNAQVELEQKRKVDADDDEADDDEADDDDDDESDDDDDDESDEDKSDEESLATQQTKEQHQQQLEKKIMENVAQDVLQHGVKTNETQKIMKDTTKNLAQTEHENILEQIKKTTNEELNNAISIIDKHEELVESEINHTKEGAIFQLQSDAQIISQDVLDNISKRIKNITISSSKRYSLGLGSLMLVIGTIVL